MGFLVLDVLVHKITEGAGGPLALAVLKRVLPIAYGNVVFLRPVPALFECHGAATPDPHKALPAVGPVREHECLFAARIDTHAETGHLGIPSHVPAPAAFQEGFTLISEPADISLFQFLAHRTSLVKSPQSHRW